MGRKLRTGRGALPPFGGRGLGPHPTQSHLGRGLRPCQVPASSLQPLGRIKHGPKIWGAQPPFWGGGAGYPSNTKSPGPRPTSIPSDILIHAAIWPQQICGSMADIQSALAEIRQGKKRRTNDRMKIYMACPIP